MISGVAWGWGPARLALVSSPAPGASGGARTRRRRGHDDAVGHQEHLVVRIVAAVLEGTAADDVARLQRVKEVEDPRMGVPTGPEKS